MSDFLANLVRRSVGLAPTVRSRHDANAADVDGAPSEPHGADVLPPPLFDQTAPQFQHAAIEPAALPPAADRTPNEMRAPSVTPQPIAATATPLVQRTVLLAPPPPLPLPGGLAPVIVSTPPTARHPGTNDTPAEPVTPLAARAMPIELPVEAHASPVSPPQPPESRPERTALVMPEPRILERVTTQTRVIEATPDIRPAAIADVSPSPAPLAPPVERLANDALSPPERVVHVRIGAIEIHDAAPPVSAPHSPASPPAPVPSSSDVGFERFARLRGYAPVEW